MQMFVADIQDCSIVHILAADVLASLLRGDRTVFLRFKHGI